ncbi:MAG: hypothetical protein ACLSV2_16895 [Clostridium sp.]
MNNLDKQIIKFIKQGGRRIKLNIFIDNLLVSLLVALVLCSIVCLVGLFIPIYNLLEICIGIITISMIIYLIIYIYRLRPNLKRIALMLDSKGLNERVITSLELVNNDENLSISQKEDTISIIKEIKISKITPFHLKRKNIYRLVAVLLVLVIIICIPTVAKSRAKEIRKIKVSNKELIERIKEEKKDTKTSKELVEDSRLNIIKELDKSIDEIKKSESKVDTEKAINKLEKKLDNIKDKLKDEYSKNKLQNIMKNISLNKEKESERLEILKNISEELSKINKMKELSKAINSTDENKIKEALNKLEDEFKSMEKVEMKEISDKLNEIAINMSDENIKAALSSTASALSNGQVDLSKLENALIGLSNSASNSNSESNNIGSTNNEQGSGNGSSQGNGSGQGLGNGSGSGNGSGWSTGNKHNGEGELNSGEKVFLPDRKSGTDGNLKGNISEGGNSQSITTENGLNISGDAVDYESIIHEYSKSEIEGLKNKSIPVSLQELIKKYFEELK